MGFLRVTATGALIDGGRRVTRSPAVFAWVFVATLLTAVPFSLAMREAIRASFGNSLGAEQAVRGVNYQWWTEFLQANPNGITRTFTPTVIGFAAVLDNMSTLLDRGSRPEPIMLLGIGYLLLWLFLSGGILDRYARNRPTRAHEFFAACGMYFVRFLRLAPLVAAVYYVLFRYVYTWLFSGFYEGVVEDVTVERTAFFWRVGCYAVFGLLLIAVNIVFDYTKVRTIVEDRRSMIGAVGAALRFIRHNIGSVVLLYALDGLMFVAVLAIYALVSPGAGSGATAWLGVLAGQIYIAARLWTRLLFLASETALFQGRLAYPGYAAAVSVRLPEPPIVEQLTAK